MKTLLHRQADIFRDEMEKHFREQLIDLWSGNLFHQREVVNYALDGTERYVLPGSPSFPAASATGRGAGVAHRYHRPQEGRGLSRISRQARRADQLHNRALYTDELNRLQRSPCARFPSSSST